MSRTKYTFVDSGQTLDEACQEILPAPIIGVDTETTGFDPYRSRIRLIQIAVPDRNFVFDLFKVRALDHPKVREVLSSPDRTKVLHNAKFDVKMLLHHSGIEVRGVFDTLLASKLIAAGAGDISHGLAAVSERYLGEEVDKSAQSSSWSGELTEAQLEYAAKDAELMLPLKLELEGNLQRLQMTEVAALEFECVLSIAAMELAGMAIDQECWLKQARLVQHAHDLLSAELKHALAEGVEQLSLFGEPEINLDSPAQIIDALGRMGVKLEGTRSWQLQPLAREHPVVQKLLEYRTVQKALTSYGPSMLDHISPVTGRLHPDFRQIGATGGRMSCSDPNLQQIPNTPEYRMCFRAPAGRKLVIADYSQIELRILADWSQDSALLKALASGEDLHCATASQMLGVRIDEVSKEQRAAAKQLNYGLMYGLGPLGLAARIECSTEEAEDLIRKYFAAYKGVAEWLRDAAERAIQDRVNRTRSGRMISFSFDPADRAQVAAMERLGKNAPIQGSSADIIKRALTRLYEPLKPFGARVVNCVHDEIVVEAPEDAAEECKRVMEREMMIAAREFVRSVPMTVDVTVSDAWLKS